MPEIDKLDLVTSVEITNREYTDPLGTKHDCYHFIYGSSCYGTLFGIFGLFNTKPGAANQLEVTEVTMRILNYSGVLNIGFSDARPYYDKKDQEMYFGVRAANGIHERTFTFPASSILVNKGQRFRLTFTRVLFPLDDMGDDPGEDLPAPNQMKEHFDSEFHFRNGVDHNYQYQRPGMAKRRDGSFTIDPTQDVDPLHKAAKPLGFPTIRCVQGIANLYWS